MPRKPTLDDLLAALRAPAPTQYRRPRGGGDRAVGPWNPNIFYEGDYPGKGPRSNRRVPKPGQRRWE